MAASGCREVTKLSPLGTSAQPDPGCAWAGGRRIPSRRRCGVRAVLLLAWAASVPSPGRCGWATAGKWPAFDGLKWGRVWLRGRWCRWAGWGDDVLRYDQHRARTPAVRRGPCSARSGNWQYCTASSADYGWLSYGVSLRVVVEVESGGCLGGSTASVRLRALPIGLPGVLILIAILVAGLRFAMNFWSGGEKGWCCLSRRREGLMTGMPAPLATYIHPPHPIPLIHGAAADAEQRAVILHWRGLVERLGIADGVREG